MYNNIGYDKRVIILKYAINLFSDSLRLWADSKINVDLTKLFGILILGDVVKKNNISLHFITHIHKQIMALPLFFPPNFYFLVESYDQEMLL
jgi:hypothetical protein